MNFAKHTNQKVFRLIILTVFVILVWISFRVYPAFFQKMYVLLLHGDVRGSVHFIRSYGPYSMIVSFLLIVFINTVAVLPNIFILAANGVIFGVVEGTIISWLAESVGVILSFILMRYFFHDVAHSVIIRSNALKRIDEFSGKQGFRVMLVARCIPYVPSGLITALGAVSSITLADYALATFIGKLPSAWIEVTLGHDLLSYQDHVMRLTLLIFLSIALYYFLARKKKQQ
ncbi:putative membrane protein YdjX (TVP38/TMEM64 family) [Sporomusaceae bacterium BoRhaA]|uniref:TVP38/TMEM64 family protein n=1 Tax=Pelorhabdus rhamnosifermentans TaxID=2772457 RepID=UPI001C060780|nr:TVP38/TMEM64 family protein [Pelorhabdus rhamnosifermentans]MBU2700372.1 putative membrane protein YdjX (TVP38/TMEM64 family) [Pelorhabdus rhamnosifermentans]